MQLEFYRVLVSTFFLLLLATPRTKVSATFKFSESQASELSTIQNNEEFFQRFLHNERGTGDNIHEGAGEGDEGEGLAEPSACEIRMSSVSLPQPDEEGIFHWPLCTRVARCSGCCIISGQQCSPTSVERKPLKVARVRHSDGKFQLIDYIAVEIDHHLGCSCSCKLHASSCDSAKQTFDEDSCQCRCKTSTACPANKEWDPTLCSCICKNKLQCSDREFFSPNSCRCVEDSSMIESSALTSSELKRICGRKSCPSNQVLALLTSPCICKRG